MRSVFPFVLVLSLLITGCGGAATDEAPAPAISTSAVDNLIPGQLARGAALQTEIRSAGNDCNKVVRVFQQGIRDGEDVWNAECEGGGTFGIVSRAEGDTEVLSCDELEHATGTSCWEKLETN
jgi:hypothetical protein